MHERSTTERLAAEDWQLHSGADPRPRRRRASVTALVSSRGEITLVESQIGRQVVSTWHPDVVREAPGAWYVATGMFLAPIAFDPIPRILTDAGLPVVGIMYDVIPFRHPELYFDNGAAIRQAAVRGHLARTVDVTARSRSSQPTPRSTTWVSTRLPSR